MVALVLLNACDSVMSRHLVIYNESKTITREVEEVFDLFATKHGFTCNTKETSPLLKECSASGPRFLRIEQKGSSFVVELDQPFPGPAWQAPKKYTEAAEELSQIFRKRFVNRVEVLSKGSPNQAPQADGFAAAGLGR